MVRLTPILVPVFFRGQVELALGQARELEIAGEPAGEGDLLKGQFGFFQQDDRSFGLQFFEFFERAFPEVILEQSKQA